MFDSTIEVSEALNDSSDDSFKEQGYQWLCAACDNQPTFETIYELFNHKKSHANKKSNEIKDSYDSVQDLSIVDSNDVNLGSSITSENITIFVSEPDFDSNLSPLTSSSSSSSSEDIPLASLKLDNSQSIKPVENSVKKPTNKQRKYLINNNNSKKDQNSIKGIKKREDKIEDERKEPERDIKEEKENHQNEFENIIGKDYIKVEDDCKITTTKPKVKHLCKICNTEFQTRIELSTHKKTHLFQDTGCFKCETCGKLCPKYDNFTRHLTIHNSNRQKSHQCTHCFASFYNLADLKRHMVLHLEVKPFRCEHCGEGFIRQDNLLIHAYKHTGVQYKKFACKDCDKVLNSPSALVMHAKTHSVKTVFCPEPGCKFSCYLQSQLRQHVRKHSGEKPFQCSKCGRCFARSNDMKNHVLNVHEGIKPFKCSSCPKEFALIGNLRIHKITHTNERPYLCAQCGKCFNQSSTLRKHSILMHNPWRSSGESKRNKKQLNRNRPEDPDKIGYESKKDRSLPKAVSLLKPIKSSVKKNYGSETPVTENSCKVDKIKVNEQFSGLVLFNESSQT